MITLQYLEKIEKRSNGWSAYIALRSIEVQKHIDRLRFFALRRPGKVQNHCLGVANSLQARLNRVLDKQKGFRAMANIRAIAEPL